MLNSKEKSPSKKEKTTPKCDPAIFTARLRASPKSPVSTVVSTSQPNTSTPPLSAKFNNWKKMTYLIVSSTLKEEANKMKTMIKMKTLSKRHKKQQKLMPLKKSTVNNQKILNLRKFRKLSPQSLFQYHLNFLKNKNKSQMKLALLKKPNSNAWQSWWSQTNQNWETWDKGTQPWTKTCNNRTHKSNALQSKSWRKHHKFKPRGKTWLNWDLKTKRLKAKNSWWLNFKTTSNTFSNLKMPCW